MVYNWVSWMSPGGQEASHNKEAANPYARWFVAVKSPDTYGSWEYGDTYVSEITSNTQKV
jgi:hypothetical protein